MKAHLISDSEIAIFCPGCDEAHEISIAPGRWTFNGNLDSPTISPSILRRSGHFASHFKPGDNCWCTYDAERPDSPSGFKCSICHSFVRDGQIQFLGDCSHELVGLTVELPEWNET